MNARRILGVLLLTTALAASGFAMEARDDASGVSADHRLAADPEAGATVLLASALPPAFPTAVFEGPAGSIGSEWISIRKRFLGTQIERFLLDLTLEELRAGGAVVFIGAQQVALTETAFIGEGQPQNSFATVEVAWTTGPIELLSEVRACLQLQRIRPDGTLDPIGVLECRELSVSPPF